VNRMRATGALVAIVLILAACGPAASDSGEPSAEGSAQESAPASEPQSSDGGPLPSFSAGLVAELEAYIPDTVAGLTMQKQSMRGNDYLLQGDDPTTVKFLEDLGVSPSDVSLAFGFGFSEDASVIMFVFRAAGADSGRLVAAFKESTDASAASPMQWSDANVGGKQVEVAGDGADTTYLYTKGDILFFLSASDPAVAEDLIRGLP